MRRPQPGAGLQRHHRRLQHGDRAGRHVDLPGAALLARPRRGRSKTARQQSQPRSHRRRAHRRSCARPTTRSSASPISSATICARRWSTSWASPASSRNCAATSSGASPASAASRRWRQRRRRMPPTAPNPLSKAPTSSFRRIFREALGFIKSSIAKMDRLISAILNLTREGRREFQPERIDMRELIEAIVTTVAHQAAEAECANPHRRRCRTSSATGLRWSRSSPI